MISTPPDFDMTKLPAGMHPMDLVPKPVGRDEWYLHIAKIVSTASKDPSTQVGAVVVVGSTCIPGFNGFPRGVTDYAWRWCRPYKYKHVEHAERNALHNAAGLDVSNGTMYITHYPPCSDCVKAMIQRGIIDVVCGPEVIKSSLEFEGVEMLNEVNIPIRQIRDVPYSWAPKE